MHRKTPLTLSLVKNLFLKEGDNHENILIPVGTAIINVADVKYALVEQIGQYLNLTHNVKFLACLSLRILLIKYF